MFISYQPVRKWEDENNNYAKLINVFFKEMNVISRDYCPRTFPETL
jgi:hypothetical protein